MLKKIIDWGKRWSFMLLVVGIGVCFLTIFDYWHVYATPLYSLQEWWQRQTTQTDSDGEVQISTSSGDWQVSWEDKVSSEESRTAQDTVSNGDLQAAYQDTVSGGNLGNADKEEESEGMDTEKELVYQNVSDDYFKDAVFIGDSRTVGLYEYGGWEEIATFYASTGLTIYKLFDASIVEVKGQKQKITVEQALSENTFSKIYLMIGINEMGVGTVDSFMEEYALAVEHLRKLQPEAKIYLQGIMKVTTKRSEQGDYITNAGIEERNARIAKLADNRTIFYLDVNPYICDDTGGMDVSYTYDGVHLKAQQVLLWKDYLKSHAIVTSNEK